IGGPNLLLIISLWFIPPISATGPGITADMGIGFSFLHTFIQHFFINLSVLYIALRVASAVFKPGCRGRSLIDVHPVVSRHFLNSFRTFSVYIACYVFIDETFLNHFASGVIYKLCLIAMTLPIPFYLTVRILKLKRISHLVSEAESSGRFSDDIADAASNTDEDPQDLDPEPAAPRLDYWFDLLFKKYWAVLAVLMVWVLTLASLVNPLNVAVMFGWRLAASLAVCALAASGVRISRVLMLRLIDEEAGHGRHLVLNTDNFFNIVIWSLTLLVLVSIWGLPVSTLARNDLAREFFSRSFTIVLVVAVLAVFIRFSHLAADWLMAVPSLSSNRNLRTITPLALAAMRFLAVFVALVVVLDRLGVNIGPILAGAGILGLGVGMGAQSLVKDVINGASILMMDTLSVGDWVTVGGKSGTVETVGLRSIRLRDSAGNLNVVPNSSIDVIVNMTRDYSQDLIEFTAPYDADPDDMLKLSAEVAADLSADPAWRRRLIAPISVVGVVGFDSGGTTIRLKVSTTAGEQWAVGRELRLRLKRRMLKDGLKSPWFGRNVFLFKGGAGQGVEAEPDFSDQDLTAAESEKGPGGVDSK
ncbi:mechanosensitive ion channel family protein, partial [Deltaproteobacteria bacterium OttesenSCG-928-K17]|nr:mechanosensitive ion channel family protein [Deltaproteobacteria bacterium OttesenSCG-928-K17]